MVQMVPQPLDIIFIPYFIWYYHMKMVFFGSSTINTMVFTIEERNNINPSHMMFFDAIPTFQLMNVYYFF